MKYKQDHRCILGLEKSTIRLGTRYRIFFLFLMCTVPIVWGVFTNEYGYGRYYTVKIQGSGSRSGSQVPKLKGTSLDHLRLRVVGR
jgi:hypothetical protein